MKQLPLLLSSIFLCLVVTATASAHKVNVFAYAEAGTIIGEASFSGGRPAQNTEISVQDRATGTVLLQTRSDSQGTFSFPVPDEARSRRLDLLIVALAGEGHRNDWLLTADEYLPEDADTHPGGASSAPADTLAAAAADQIPAPDAGPSACSAEQWRQLIESAIAKEVAPLKRLVLETRQSEPGLRDILGGIGYIVGVFGAIALIKAQKGEKR